MICGTNTAPNSLLKVAQHCVGLATASLTIRKDARVVPRQAVVHDWLADNCTHDTSVHCCLQLGSTKVQTKPIETPKVMMTVNFNFAKVRPVQRYEIDLRLNLCSVKSAAHPAVTKKKIHSMLYNVYDPFLTKEKKNKALPIKIFEFTPPRPSKSFQKAHTLGIAQKHTAHAP